MSKLSRALVLVGLAALPEAAPAQHAAAANSATPTFGATSASVLVDVVVRDKHGKLIRDLTADDFEVFEDGVRQEVSRFAVSGTRVPREGATPRLAAGDVVPAATGDGAAPASGPPAQPEAPKDTAVLALVFDRLSPEGRRRAQEAALKLLESERPATDVVSVFSLDLALKTVLGFTDSRAEARAAVNKWASVGAIQKATDSARRLDAMRSSGRLTDSIAGLSSGQSGSSSGQSQTEAQQALATMTVQRDLLGMTVKMEQTFEELEREQAGLATSNGLLAIVNAMRTLPGRKHLIFFSEGLSIPAAVQAQFRSVVHSANRANVAIYSLDVAGLRLASGSSLARDEINAAAVSRIQSYDNPDDISGAGPLTKALEWNENVLRLDPHSGLGMLSDETGGFLIRETNDLGPGLARIAEEMRFYYFLGYAPSNATMDGRFREIAVKVKRPGVHVQARKGYFAVRSLGPVLAYETAPLTVLEGPRPPGGYPIHVEAFSFPARDGTRLIPVVVEVPGTAPTYVFDADKKSYRGDFAVLVRIMTDSGEVAEKLSRRYLMTVPADRIEAAKRGNLLFYRETHLPKGHYVVDAVAYDNVNDRASVRSMGLEVAAEGKGRLGLSSVVLVGRVEALPAAEIDPERPFQYGGVLIYPNLGQPLRKSAQKQLAFYVLVQVPPGGAAPQATFELWRRQERLLDAPVTLGAPDARGRIQHVGTIGVESLPPGEYTLRVRASDGTSTEMQSESFTLDE